MQPGRLVGGHQLGFTLIEVTLSVVIGIVLIAGATLLYQQAKVGAGNTRARAKVAALQGVVEEVSANAGGNLPLASQVYGVWVQRRPDDYAQSPWGGRAVGNVGTPGYLGTDNQPTYTFVFDLPSGFSSGANAAGCVQYVDFAPPTATASWYDTGIGTPSPTLRGYATWCYDPGGFKVMVTGGK